MNRIAKFGVPALIAGATLMVVAIVAVIAQASAPQAANAQSLAGDAAISGG